MADPTPRGQATTMAIIVTMTEPTTSVPMS